MYFHNSPTHKCKVPASIDSTTSSKEEMDVVVDETTSIFCDAKGVGDPQIEWLQNGFSLRGPRHRLLEDNKRLQIIQTQIEDAGRYTCIAKNNAGVADRDFELFLLGLFTY